MADTVVPGRAPLWRSRTGAWGNALVLGWLAAGAAAVLARGVLPVPLWLAVHLFTLGAVSTAIVLWSEHFLVTWCRTPASPRWSLPGRIVMLTLATATVLGGVSAGLTPAALAGVAAIVGVGVWHAAVLARLAHRARLVRFRHVGRYYPAAAAALVVAVLLAAMLVTSGGGPRQAWLGLAHAHLAVLGWIGLTVLGTLVILWPTVLRTRIVAGAEWAGRAAWWPLVVGLAVLTGGFLAGQRTVAVAGVICYAVGAAVSLAPFCRTVFRRAPHDAASWMLAAGTGWLLLVLAGDAAVLVGSPSPRQALARAALLLAPLLAGFVAQVLTGALSYLLVPVLAAGPEQRRHITALLARAWVPRLILANVAVPPAAVPVAWAHTVGWTALTTAYGSFVALALRAVVVARRHPTRRRSGDHVPSRVTGEPRR